MVKFSVNTLTLTANQVDSKYNPNGSLMPSKELPARTVKLSVRWAIQNVMKMVFSKHSRNKDQHLFASAVRYFTGNKRYKMTYEVKSLNEEWCFRYLGASRCCENGLFWAPQSSAS